MPTKYKDYPIYTYNEPATYNDFTGGINTDPSNEHLLKNEMRDCVNMTYLSGALVKRKGAKEICKITCDEDIKNIQGVFLFTYKITYIIIAADGKLYQSVFNENTTLHLTRLNIFKELAFKDLKYDETSVLDGIDTLQKSDSIPEKHDGFIQDYIKNDTNGNTLQLNNRGDWNNISSGMIEIGDYFEKTEGLYTVKYVCIKEFEKTIISPLNKDYWQELDSSSPDYVSKTKDYTIWSRNLYTKWSAGKVVSYTIDDVSKFYECIATHYNRLASIYDESLFIKSSLTNTNYSFYSVLIFQNYRKIEAATFNNKLFIMTGTRIVTVEVKENKLVASVLSPHICNLSEITNIGYNYISPYPELALATQTDTVTTNLGQLLVKKTAYGKYRLEPILNIQMGDSINNYLFRWEKYINNTWYTIIPFKIQDINYQKVLGQYLEKTFSNIEVEDADTVLYRVTFARSFETPSIMVNDWDISEDSYSFEKNQLIKYNSIIYKCLIPHNKSNNFYPNGIFSTVATIENQVTQIWEIYMEYENLPYAYEKPIEQMKGIEEWSQNKGYNNGDYVVIKTTTPYQYYQCQTSYTSEDNYFENGFTDVVTINNIKTLIWKRIYNYWEYTNVEDYKIDKIDGEFFGQATSVLWKDLSISDNFKLIHSCTKILVDGNKMLYYGDNYNSGQWFKTIINNPGYVTDRGSLSFKTTKNEELIKIIAFQGNIICFANSENVGGSIHIVTGNGDDYDASDGYYSPYQRRTINSTVSSDNPDTIQVCDNYLIFKYFKKLYYINASDLSNDVIKVTQCNTKVLSPSRDVEIPWDDNSCISEVTNDYYALIWKEKFSIDNNNKLVQERPGIRLKLYFNMQNQMEDKSYEMPWLRDESKYFNTDLIFYYKGRSLMLYNNILISFNEDTYEDLEEAVTCTIKFRGEELGYAKITKLISNILVYYFRNQHSKIDFDLITRNEAGHILYNSKNKNFSVGDLRNLKEKDVVSSERIRLDSTIQDTKLFTVPNKFPCLLAESTITAENKGTFSLSSITYYYDTIDMPDSNPYDMYTNIIRPEEVE